MDWQADHDPHKFHHYVYWNCRKNSIFDSLIHFNLPAYTYKMKTIIYTFFAVLLMAAAHSTIAQNVTFGLMSDVHYANKPSQDSWTYSQSLAKLSECIDTMNKYKVDFVIETGDFKDMAYPGDKKKVLYDLSTIENIFTRFEGKRFHVMGNHDMDFITKQEFLGIARNSGIRSDRSYYSFNDGGIHFVVLDACFDSVGNDYANGNFAWSDCNIPQEEFEWLKNDLNGTLNPVVVLTHHLLDGRGIYTIRNAPQVRAILEKSRKVICVFQGHYHEGRYSQINNIHYYTMRSMVGGDFPESSSYAMVKISPQTIQITGFHRAVSLTLKFSELRLYDDYRHEGDYDWEPWEEQ